ncbi:MAG: hypothetical protein K0Q55_2515 [Verrucomicrobia bacterium]|nr:hypothetical protein [Verrucomicrobiota bacterium]
MFKIQGAWSREAIGWGKAFMAVGHFGALGWAVLVRHAFWVVGTVWWDKMAHLKSRKIFRLF